mmetsp:Transcript_33081/g.63519  ORF Transcript_33081/g.63519 Transcript_33081/m.63519 type:complete len:544 (+) Transcript_33081:99-1730(+)
MSGAYAISCLNNPLICYPLDAENVFKRQHVSKPTFGHQINCRMGSHKSTVISHGGLHVNLKSRLVSQTHHLKCPRASITRHHIYALETSSVFSSTLNFKVKDCPSDRSWLAARRVLEDCCRWMPRAAQAVGVCVLGMGVITPAQAATVQEQYASMASPALEQASERGVPNALGYKKDLFTEDAWQGMLALEEYAQLVRQLAPEEEACGAACATNRAFVEAAWQTVSNEYYDATGAFSQATWSAALTNQMREAGGLLRTRGEAYSVVSNLIATLGDSYSRFLPAEEYRKATLKPTPGERRYLEVQYSGVGVDLGSPSEQGGYEVSAALAGSPAEEAGVRRGDRLLAIDDIAVGPGITMDGYTDVDGINSTQAAGLLRGPPGSPVKLTVSSAADPESVRRLLLERRYLPRPPVSSELITTTQGQKVQYVRVFYFTSQATLAFQDAILAGEMQGVDGFIVDLRNNPGGVFEEAISMATMMLDTCPTSSSTGFGCEVTHTVRSTSGGGADVVDEVFATSLLPPGIFPLQPSNLTHSPVVILPQQQRC